jgi:hypothetical protein
VNRKAFTVVGVMPSGYSGQLRGGLWIPYTMQARFFAGRDLFREPVVPWLVMVGRLASPSSRPAAQAELGVIASRQDRLVPGRKTTVRFTNGSLIQESYMRPLAAWIVPLVMGSLSLVFLMAAPTWRCCRSRSAALFAPRCCNCFDTRRYCSIRAIR